jgi:hypothetical protein
MVVFMVVLIGDWNREDCSSADQQGNRHIEGFGAFFIDCDGAEQDCGCGVKEKALGW